MQSISILFIAFVGIGLSFHKFTTKTRLLVLLVAACTVAFVTLH